MSTIVSSVQMDILRRQFQRVMREGNGEEILGLWNSAVGEFADKLAEALTEEEIAQFEARANEARALEAETRLEKAEAIVAQKEERQKANRTYTEDESRINAARELYRWGFKFERVVTALERPAAEFNGMDAKKYGDVLDCAISDGAFRKGSWIEAAVRNQRDKLRLRAESVLAEQEREAVENALAERGRRIAEEEKAFGFLAMPLRMLAALRRDQVPEQTLLAIEKNFQRFCRPADAWAPWALDALERLLDRADDEGQLAYAVDQDLFKQVMEAHDAECHGAFTLVSGIHAAVRSGVERHRQAKRKALAERQVRRRASQLDRARRTNTPPGGRPKQKKKR